MRAGKQRNVHEIVRRFLIAGARIHLGRAWALDFLAYMQALVEQYFPLSHTPRATLRVRAAEAAAAHRAAELESLARAETTAQLRVEAEALQESLGASGHLLAVIRAELAERTDE